jgi:hypothetical protein
MLMVIELDIFRGFNQQIRGDDASIKGDSPHRSATIMKPFS